MKMNIKKGDTVYVITGKDKGKSGKITAVYSDKNKVLIENVNIVTKHQKPKSQQDKGGIVKKPAPVDASNVMVVCPVCNKATRISHKEIDGKKARICKKCGASLDKEFVKQTKKKQKNLSQKRKKKKLQKKLLKQKRQKKLQRKNQQQKKLHQKSRQLQRKASRSLKYGKTRKQNFS